MADPTRLELATSAVTGQRLCFLPKEETRVRLPLLAPSIFSENPSGIFLLKSLQSSLRQKSFIHLLS